MAPILLTRFPSSRIQAPFKNRQRLDHVVIARPTTIGPFRIQPTRINPEENVTPVGLRRSDARKIHQCQVHPCARSRIIPTDQIAQYIIKILCRVHPHRDGERARAKLRRLRNRHFQPSIAPIEYRTILGEPHTMIDRMPPRARFVLRIIR